MWFAFIHYLHIAYLITTKINMTSTEMKTLEENLYRCKKAYHKDNKL